MRVINIVKLSVVVFFMSSCQSTTSSNQESAISSTGDSLANLENRESFVLPAELAEISGHTFVKGNDDVVYAVQDETGSVFAFNLKLNKIDRTINFADVGDYEGITNDGQYFYVLKSNGSIISFPIDEDLNETNVKEFKKMLSKGEYESLGIDTVNRQLAVLCKSCKIDNRKNQVTGYILNYSNEGDVTENKSFIIDIDKTPEIYPKFPKVFNPSAITKNSTTGEWYILSSIDKLILITDSNFKPLSVIPFSRKLYEQPEGISFDSKGALYISSEAGDEPSGMIYKIK